MRVLQVHNRYRAPGGEDTVVANEARLLASAGHQVFEHQVRNAASSRHAAFDLSLSAWNPMAARQLRSHALEVRPEVAHVHNTWFRLSGSVFSALRQAGCAVVMTVHNYRLVCANATLLRGGRICEDCVRVRNASPGVRYRCYRGSAVASTAALASIELHRRRGTWARDVDLLLATSDFVKQVLVRAGLPGDRVTVKHHFTADPGAREAPPSASKTVLFVGRLSPEKGADLLVDAWNAAAPVDLTLDVVGDGPMRESLRAAAGPQVRFSGRLTAAEVRERMRHARAVIAPSIWHEPFGMVLIESLACGAPVIASDAGAFPEVLGELAERSVVPAGDRDALCDAISALADDVAVDRDGAECRRVYERRFTPAVGLAALEAAYEDALARRG